MGKEEVPTARKPFPVRIVGEGNLVEIQPIAVIGRGTTEGKESLAKPLKAAAAFVNQRTSSEDLIRKTGENPSAFCEGDLSGAVHRGC